MAGVVLLSASVLVAGVATMQPASLATSQILAKNSEKPVATLGNAEIAAPRALAGTNMAGDTPGANAGKMVPGNTGLVPATTTPTTFVVVPTASRLYSFDTSVGSAAPPDTLGGHPMTAFNPDPNPTGYYPTTSLPTPCDVAGTIGFNPAVGHARIGDGWMSWSHGYTGDIYYTNGALSVTITLPPVTNCAFYWYTEPNPFSDQTFLVEADDGSSTTFTANGSAGAAYCGVFGANIGSVTITCTSGNDFSIGEFGIACFCEPIFRACCFEAVPPAYCIDQYDVLQCITEGGRWSIDAEFCTQLLPACGEYMGACCYGAQADPGYEPWQCIGDYLQWECLYLSEYTNWTGGASCSDPFFVCPGTPTYCDASGGCDEFIARVQMNEIDNSTGCDQYADYTTIWTTVIVGMEYPITVTNGTPYSADSCSIWVDWNQDKTFEDTSPELIGDALGGGTSPPYSLTLTVPTSGGLPGYTRMRIRIDYNNPDPDPCGTTTYGEVEDYSLLVVYEGTGACCNIYDGTCNDAVEALACIDLGSQWRWYFDQQCGELNPVCGDPGCCCDSPETGVVTDPHFAYRVNCNGRFISGAGDCVAAAFSPDCGLWQPTGVMYAPTNPDNAGFRSAVAALLNSPVDYVDARVTTPTLDQLQPYAAVLTWGNYAYASSAGMGDVLADFVDANGKVILGQWTYHTTQVNWLEGRIMTPEYCPAVCSGYGPATYAGDGTMCQFDGPAGTVGAMAADYADIAQPAAGALSDGTLGSGVALAFWGAFNVYYSAGNSGLDYCSGDWATLTANMVLCAPGPGACCDRSTAACIDQLTFAECQAHGPAWQWRMGLCADLVPVCGNPGACCDVHTGSCIDDVLQYNCLALGRAFYAGQQCGEMNPPCGDPGCCCEAPEAMVLKDPVFAYRANCNGRFISGATPLCGDLDGNMIVDMTDYNMFLDTFGKCDGQPGYLAGADLDGDGCVTLVDFQQWRICYETPGTGCTAEMFTPDCGLWVPVGLMYAIADVDDSAYRAAISALIGQPVDYFDAMNGTPTVEQMSTYAAVMCWVNYPLADNVAMGNNLADYVDGGGVAILGQWCFPTASNFLAGRIMTSGYCPASSGAGWGSASFSGPGTDCVTNLFTVASLANGYCDIITGLVAGSGSDGLFSNGSPVAAWRPDRKVYYSAGNMSAIMYGAQGNWAELTANYMFCGSPDITGACCNQFTAECVDGVGPTDCAGLQWHYQANCAELNPECGDPGCCCDSPEPGVVTDPHFALRANCDGRFISALVEGCVAAAFSPECGLFQPTGVLYAPTQADNAGFRSALSALLNSPVDYFDARGGTPTLAQLEPYACVFTWCNYAYSNPVGMGDVLADFVDGNGKVILGQWCLPTANNWLQGRIMTAEYCPATASSWASGTYAGDGVMCPFDGPTGLVASFSSGYCDVITVLPTALADGTMGGHAALALRPDFMVYYSPGNTGLDYSSGDTPILTANMVLCSPAPGACCDIATAACTDGVLFADCIAQGPTWRFRQGECALLVPPCGNPGACCDVYTGNCVDDVLQYNCANQFWGGQQCGELNPECGDPGCCCDSPESGVVTDPHFAYRANCSGRFISGAVDCVAAAFIPECGLWQPVGLLYAPAEADAAAFRAAVSALIGQPVDYFDARVASPSVAQMSEYAAVLVWVNYPLFNNVEMGDNLADYVDGGGKAILGQWCFPTAGNYLAGRIMTAAYCPVSAASGWGSGSLATVGTDCVFILNPVTTLSTSYLDNVTALVPGSFSSGTFTNNAPVAAWNVGRKVYYSAGNAGALGIGNWAILTANMVICTDGELIGACCDLYEAPIPGGPGFCMDEVAAQDCAAPQAFYLNQICAELNPPCGNPGACCDDLAVVCTEGVLKANCAGRHAAGLCADLTPACGAVCPHSVVLWDSYGDGWNGNTLDVYVDGGLVLSGITLPSGAGPAPFTFLAGTGSEIHTVYNAIGGWPYEPYYMIYDGLGILIIQDGGAFIQPTGVTVAGNCEPIYGACCDGFTGVCVNNVSIFDCTGQFTEEGQCEELTPPCGNPGACCDDTTAICVDGVMQLACTGRFAAATLCAVLDPACGVVPPCEDAQLVAPGTWNGNTCGAGNDCALRSSEDLIVKVTIPTAGNWQFDLCGGTSVWDSYMYLGSDCCTGTWYDDDGCGTVFSRIQRPALPAGTYYATIEAYSTACGAVTFHVGNYEPEDRAVPAQIAPTKLEELMPELRN